MGINNYVMQMIGIPNEKKKKTVLRRRIADIINTTELNDMIFIVAPYGCGKTMAVLSWLKQCEKNAAWINLYAEDNSPISFWVHFSVVILFFSGEQKKAEDILNGSHFIENPLTFAKEILIEVSPTLNDRVLVIDNFRNIQNINLLHEIKDLLCGMIGFWRVIIISRSELPPIFNDFMLKKKLQLITLSELNFTLDEMSEYFSLNGHAVERNNLVQLQNETDGWPIAINVILTIPHNKPFSFNNVAKVYIKDFFEEKVWQQISDEKAKDFLLKTSILDRLTPAICLYVTEIDETYRILKYLHMNGIFITKLEDTDAYSYHHVFRDFLLSKLEHSEIDINKLYIKVGWWLYEKNESILALRCFYKCKCLQGINQAFKKIRPADIGMERYLEETFCLTSLDVMDMRAYPEVAVRIALLHFITGNISEMKRINKVVSEWIKPGILSISPEEYIDFFWEIGWLRYVNPDEDILFNSKFDEWVNVEEYAPHLLESDRSRASALRLPSVLRGVRDFSLDIERADEYYRFNKKNSKVKDEAALFIMDLIEAEIAYEREDFYKAEMIINEITPKIEKAQFSDLYFTCTELLIKICRAEHNLNEIDSLIERLKKTIENNGHLFLMPNFHAFELRNRLAQGNVGLTDIFTNENKPYECKPYYYLIYRHITHVRALLSENKYREAILILGNLELLCLQYKRNMDLIEVNLLRSMAEYGLKHESEACQHIITALDFGRKSGFIRIFSDDAISLWPIINLIRKHDRDAYIKKVILSCKRVLAHTGIKTAIDQQLNDTLTKSEIEILKLLHVGMSYQEIADTKQVAIGTVRTHITHIFSKLDVNNKTSAVVKAEQWGLI